MSDNRVTVTIAGPSYQNAYDAPATTNPRSVEWRAFVLNLRAAIDHAQQLAAIEADAVYYRAFQQRAIERDAAQLAGKRCDSCGGTLRPAARIDGPAEPGECSCWQGQR